MFLTKAEATVLPSAPLDGSARVKWLYWSANFGDIYFSLISVSNMGSRLGSGQDGILYFPFFSLYVFKLGI